MERALSPILRNMTENGDRVFSKLLDDRLVVGKVAWWPEGGRKVFPTETSKETDDCQPFVTEMLSLFVTGEVKVTFFFNKIKRDELLLPSEAFLILLYSKQLLWAKDVLILY